MTKQETFDIVARHLLTQNAKSADGNGSCLYRDESGRKCAIGCLVPDEKYDADLEDTALGLNPRLNEAVGDHDHSLLDAMRDVHDGEDVCEWPYCLTEVAKAYGLSDAVVTELRGPAASQ